MLRSHLHCKFKDNYTINNWNLHKKQRNEARMFEKKKIHTKNITYNQTL